MPIPPDDKHPRSGRAETAVGRTGADRQLLSVMQDYCAPIADDGFTDDWLTRAASEPSSQDDAAYSEILSRLNLAQSGTASTLRRSLVALSMGAAAGAVWMRAGPLLWGHAPTLTLPTLPSDWPALSANLGSFYSLPLLVGAVILFGIAALIVDSVSSF